MIMRKQEAAVLFSALIFYIIIFCHSYASGSNELVAINNCTCEGYDQVYECSVTGSGATVWTGTAFDCSNNEIIILHSSSSTGVEITCNDGAIVGHLIRAENNTYVSQLTVSVSAQMVGTNISCSHDSRGTHLIGSSILTLSTDPYPPPSDVHLLDINSTHLTFHWSPVSSNCNAVHYRITSSNCGHCPNHVNSTSVTCSGPFINGQLCTFAVQTVVCDNVVGNESNRVQVVIRMPSAPVVNVIPTYSYKTKRLIALATQFSNLEPFNVSEGIDGSASSYTITYMDSTTDVACASATVSASSCVNRKCEHKLELPSTSCSDSTEVSVQVSGSNRLGNGLLSTPVLVQGVTNQFVDLSFDPASKIITCLFLHQPKVANEKTCVIVYGVPGRTCTMFSHQSSKSLSDKVYLGFPELSDHLQSLKECCFIATATNGTFTVSVEGLMLVTQGTSASTSRFKFTIGILPFGAAMGAMALIIIIITITFILITVTLVRSRRALRVDLERLKAKAIEQPAIYEELDYVHMAPKPASSPTIDTGQNTAYLSFSGLFSKAILS